MGTWLNDTISTGTLAAATTTTAVAILGRSEGGSAIAPINAVSHILWGRKDSNTEELDAPHTLVGAGLNAMATTSWAGLHELFMPRHERPSVQRALLGGAATAVVAYITDYHVVPKRFTPGFEERLSDRALFGVYTVLALSLAAGSLFSRR